jgi:sugar (pentulose or hexulose) kinase
VTSLGTTMTLKLPSDAPVFAPAYDIRCHRIGEFWLTDGASNGGGVVLADHFPPQRRKALSARHPP